MTTLAEDDQPPVPDLVGRDFTAERPGSKLVGDIPYVKTWSGWVYLATVVNCATKMVVGWSIDTHMRTSLVTAALEMAKGRIPFADNCIFHSDRGAQYMSAEYQSQVDSFGTRLPHPGRSHGRTPCITTGSVESP